MKKVLVLLNLLFSFQSANALPLLSESAALNAGSNLTLYPDHEDPTKFYFFPNSSKIARDESNMPLFTFTHYGLSNGGAISEAGGFMVGVMRLTSSNDQQVALDKFLQSRSGAGVAVLPVLSSTVNLVNTSDKMAAPLKTFFTEFNLPPHGGRAEDEAGFNAVLTGLGAKLMKKHLEGTVGIKFDYCYQVQGLGPNMDANIKLNYKRIHDQLKVKFGLSYSFWTRIEIEKEVESLKTRGLISWEINGGTAKDEEYLKSVANDLVNRFFKPELDTIRAELPKTELGWSFTRFQMKQVSQEQDTQISYLMKKRELTTREFCIPLPVKDLKPFIKDVILDADA